MKLLNYLYDRRYSIIWYVVCLGSFGLLYAIAEWRY